MARKEPFEQYDRTSAVYPGSDIKTFVDESGQHQWIEYSGYVVTRFGIVIVFSTQWPEGQTSTRLEIISRERLHTRIIDRIYQPRYLVTLARRFAAEVVSAAKEE